MCLKADKYTLADYGIGINLNYQSDYSEKDKQI